MKPALAPLRHRPFRLLFLGRGVTSAVWLAVAVYVSAQAAVLLVPDARRLERTDLEDRAPTAV